MPPGYPPLGLVAVASTVRPVAGIAALRRAELSHPGGVFQESSAVAAVNPTRVACMLHGADGAVEPAAIEAVAAQPSLELVHFPAGMLEPVLRPIRAG